MRTAELFSAPKQLSGARAVWLLPSRRRLGNLKRFFTSVREFGCSTPGLILVNEDELIEDRALYDALDRPAGWQIIGVAATCMHDALRCAWPLVKDQPWVGLLQDDLVLQCPGWDTGLIGGLTGSNVVSANDGNETGRMHGAIVWSGDLVRALGWIYPPGLNHLYGDDVWETLGRETGCWQIRGEIVTKHVNETYAASPDDTARHVASHTAHDAEGYKAWFENGKDEAISTIRQLQGGVAPSRMTVNMAGVQLLIATPTVHGQYDHTFLKSWHETMFGMAQNGVTVRFAQELYNADICLARSKIISMFLRSTFTHLLLIDADMGWDFNAVIRLFAAQKDFVAVAGPKKSFPLRFAASFTDDEGKVMNLHYEPAAGCAEVHEVGMAFCLLTRACVEQMAAAYPELMFRSLTGDKEFALFQPIVIKEKYFAEDFAFCYRWRNIGGRLFICPDIRLKHTGGHTFEGALAEQFKQNRPALVASQDAPLPVDVSDPNPNKEAAD